VKAPLAQDRTEKEPAAFSSKRKISIIAACMMALLTQVAIYLSGFGGSVVPLMPGGRFSFLRYDAKQLLWVVIFALLVPLYMKALRAGDKSTKTAAAVVSSVLALFYTLGAELNRYHSIDGYFSRYTGVLKLFICLFGFAALFYALLVRLYAFLEKRQFDQPGPSKEWFSDSRKSFLIMWGAIFACWVPYLIVYFPGLLSYDSMYQFRMGLGYIPFDAHHPVLHTLIMTVFIRLGNALGSQNLGVGLYSVFQMLVMSAAFSATLRYLALRGVHTYARVLMFAYFAIYPVNAMYSITAWKNIIFGGLCLLLFILIVEIIRRPEKMLFSRFWQIAVCFVTVMFCLFLNNAVYVLVLFLPFFIAVLRKYWKRTVPMVIACAICIGVFNWLAFNVFGVIRGGAVEAMSVPVQQIARVVTDRGESLTDEQTSALSRYFPVERLPQIYNPLLSDPVKNSLNTAAYSEDSAGFYRIWAELGLKYPMSYINATLSNSYGYWFPDVNFWIIHPFMHIDDALEIAPLYPLPRVERFANTAIYGVLEYMPTVSMLSSIGFMVWVIIVSAGLVVVKRMKNMLVPMLIPGFLWLTTLASPVYAEYRYIYGLMLCAPVIFVLTLGCASFTIDDPKVCAPQPIKTS